jgi:hypothetical protein
MDGCDASAYHAALNIVLASTFGTALIQIINNRCVRSARLRSVLAKSNMCASDTESVQAGLEQGLSGPCTTPITAGCSVGAADCSDCVKKPSLLENRLMFELAVWSLVKPRVSFFSIGRREEKSHWGADPHVFPCHRADPHTSFPL